MKRVLTLRAERHSLHLSCLQWEEKWLGNEM